MKDEALPDLPRRTLMPRRFPPPWTVEELAPPSSWGDSTGQKLAYVYFEDEQKNSLDPMAQCRG
jgi:hypothetical protein